jgi:hypothetical protein
VIVDPDFLDHWRTRMLVDELGDESGPLYLLRLWAHCHNRRDDTFDLPDSAVRAICRYAGDASKIVAALEKSGFMASNGSIRTMLKWREKNASLFAAWANGAKGGRPAKKPMDNPRDTHGKPNANPSETERRGVEKKRVESEGRKRFTPPTIEDVTKYCAEIGSSINPQRFIDYYEANGWVQGPRKPIRDWKACVRTWQSNGIQPNGSVSPAAATAPPKPIRRMRTMEEVST